MEKRTIALLLVMMTLATATAQPHVQAALDALKQRYAVQLQRTNQSSHDGRRSGLLEIYCFTTSDNSVVNDMIRAFDADRAQAYSFVRHDAGDDKLSYAVYYNEDDTELIGRDKHDNYLLLSTLDPEDESDSYRYCYVMEWKDDNSGGTAGRIIKTYAPKPRASRLKLNQLLPGISANDLDGLADSLGILLKELPSLDSLKRLGTVGELQRLFGDGDYDEPGDDVEWLTAFNHYRNAFKRAAERGSSSATSYATSILKLCKRAGAVHLSDSERSLCRKTLKELQKSTRDKFDRGLLDEAINLLK